MKVVSFCLYGNKATYIIGMKENLLLSKKFFSDWKVRIYYNDTVPEKYIDEYKDLGGECILCSNVGKNKKNWEGMFWRWYPLDDEKVEYWISRDADSRLSKREADLVNEWIDSGKTLHSIRDHRCHWHCIMGGMFGINNKSFHKKYKFDKIENIINCVYKRTGERPYNVDQEYLNKHLWNLLKNDYIAHVSPGGRISSPEDIKIPGVSDFIGKQYRIDDFPENKLKHLEGKNGCYWRSPNKSSIYWSNSVKNIKPDIKFNNEGDYFQHRYDNGYPQDWSKISSLSGVIVEDEDESKINKKGCYWKKNKCSSIYWSEDAKNINEYIEFKNEREYFNHRIKNGYPRNWTNINIFH